MTNIFTKNKTNFAALLLAVIFMTPTIAFAYTISGVVDFTYSSYETRVGTRTTSSRSFTEHYNANIAGYVFDPRFLRLTGGIGYNRTHSSGADYDALSYNVRATFFPGRMVSWDLYAAQSTMSVQNNGSIIGYDVDTKSYGAALALRLSKARARNGNNNFNNSGNNNNNNGDNNSNNNREGRRPWSSFGYPDIFLSRDHQESESKNQLNALHETRDNTSATILYRVNSTFDMHLAGTAEEFKNLRDASSYDTKTANLLAVTRLSPNATLKISGNMNERTVNNITGFDNTTTRVTNFGMHLEFREVNRISQNYGYDYAGTDTGGTEYKSQTGSGYLRYALLPELSLYGRMEYTESEYVRQATGTVPYDSSSLKSGGLGAGATYKKVYSPAFLDPFVFDTNYDFSTGYTETSTFTEGDLGSGIYYQNAVKLGLVSSGWKYETVSVDASYTSRRDHSPMNNNNMFQSYRFSANTQRVPRTAISAAVSYRIQESSASPFAGVFSPTAQGLNQNTRALDYSANIDHSLNQSVKLSAGATQTRATSNSGYTLSTLTTIYDTKVVQLYAQALFNYAFTRDLRFSASLREEQRMADYAADTTSYQATMGINHRIRALILSAEWRWREDVTDNSPRIFQQSLMLKVSRSF
ncbi:MAG: hypothetical protein ACYC7L_02205 [Nitrospirota bacterium]